MFFGFYINIFLGSKLKKNILLLRYVSWPFLQFLEEKNNSFASIY